MGGSAWGRKELGTTERLTLTYFFTVQLSQPYVTTGKTIALTIRTFVGNVSAFQHTV